MNIKYSIFHMYTIYLFMSFPRHYYYFILDCWLYFHFQIKIYIYIYIWYITCMTCTWVVYSVEYSLIVKIERTISMIFPDLLWKFYDEHAKSKLPVCNNDDYVSKNTFFSKIYVHIVKRIFMVICLTSNKNLQSDMMHSITTYSFSPKKKKRIGTWCIKGELITINIPPNQPWLLKGFIFTPNSIGTRHKFYKS